MSVKLLAFFDTRYRGGAEPWQPLIEAVPASRLHMPLDRPGTLGQYDLDDPQAVANIVAFARNAGVDGFVVDLRATESGYATGAEPLAVQTSENFGLAFQWKNGDDAFWKAPASAEDRAARARALIAAIAVGTPALVGGRVMLIVERPKELGAPAETLALLRQTAAAAGLPGLTLVAARAEDGDGKYTAQGYDSLVDPAADEWHSCPPNNKPSGLDLLEVMAGMKDSVEYLDKFFSYALFAVARMVNREKRGKVLPRVFPAFHDWASKPNGGAIHLLNRKNGINVPCDTYLYGLFVENAMLWAESHLPAGERVVLLDSWNGWLTGSQVEPSLFDGDLVYNATRNAIDRGRYVLQSREGAPEGGLDAATRERIALICEAAKNL